MAGRLPSSLLRRKQNQTPSIQAILIAFVVLFILFLWMDFVLTQQLESTGREIQIKTGELRLLERRQGALLKEISAASAGQSMAAWAKAQGYRPKTPIFLPVTVPLAQATSGTADNGWQPLAAMSGGEPSTQQMRFLGGTSVEPIVVPRAETAP